MIILNAENYDYCVSHGKTVLYVWATWCAPCKFMSVYMQEITDEISDSIVLMKCDADDEICSKLMSKFDIKGVPTLLFFEKGKVVKQLSGGMTKDRIIKEIKDVWSE